jgi:hypothetical protein
MKKIPMLEKFAAQSLVEYDGELIFSKEKFAELVIEAVLDEVKERAYYTGDRDWSDEVDRPWIQLEFGYGKLYDAKTSRG